MPASWPAILHAPVGRVEQAGGHLHQRRLAAAVVADEGDLGAGSRSSASVAPAPAGRRRSWSVGESPSSVMRCAPLLLGVGLALGHELPELAPPLVPAPHPAADQRRSAAPRRRRREARPRSAMCRAARPGARAAIVAAASALTTIGRPTRSAWTRRPSPAGRTPAGRALVRVGCIADDADHPPAAPPSTVGRARIAAGAIARDVPRTRPRRLAAAIDRERDQGRPPARARWRTSSSPRSIGRLSVRSG